MEDSLDSGRLLGDGLGVVAFFPVCQQRLQAFSQVGKQVGNRAAGELAKAAVKGFGRAAAF